MGLRSLLHGFRVCINCYLICMVLLIFVFNPIRICAQDFRSYQVGQVSEKNLTTNFGLYTSSLWNSYIQNFNYGATQARALNMIAAGNYSFGAGWDAIRWAPYAESSSLGWTNNGLTYQWPGLYLNSGQPFMAMQIMTPYGLASGSEWDISPFYNVVEECAPHVWSIMGREYCLEKYRHTRIWGLELWGPTSN